MPERYFYVLQVTLYDPIIITCRIQGQESGTLVVIAHYLVASSQCYEDLSMNISFFPARGSICCFSSNNISEFVPTVSLSRPPLYLLKKRVLSVN